MIAFLSGKIIESNGTEVIILTSGGVGYRVWASPAALKKCIVGSEQQLETYLVVREDAMEIFGFARHAEKQLFKSLLSVSGVGPKTALHFLSLGEVEEIMSAIARGDTSYLTKVSGVGKKTAERVVLELKEKIRLASAEVVSAEDIGTAKQDALDGLLALGYSVNEARKVVNSLDDKNKTGEELLRAALQKM